MSHRSHSASRALIGTLETLEGRQLLTTVLAVATVTTVPALSPAEVADLDFPVVNETHSITKGGKITGLVIEFSRDMAPGPVTDLRNFEVDAFRKGTRAFVPSRMSGVALKSASYDPVSHSVTLVPAAPLSLARVGKISVISAVSGGTALTDTNGDAISDSVTTSTPDGVFHAYVDPHGTWYGPGEGELSEQSAARAARTLVNKMDRPDRDRRFIESAATALAGITEPLWRPFVHVKLPKSR